MGVADTSYDLADACDSLADGLNNGRKAANYTETGGQAATLDHLTSGLEDEANNLRTAGVAASLESMNSALASINNATTQAKAAASKLKQANEMITLAGSVLSLAAAAASGNVPGIATGAAAVISEAGQLSK
jgi:hypothetical protein